MSKISTVLTGFCLLAITIGCEPAKEPAKELSFNQLAENLVSMRNTIHDAYAKGDTHAAHDPLHEVGHVLEKVAVAANNADLDAELIESIRKAKDTLMDAYGELDKSQHGGKGKSYDELSSDIDNAVKVLADAAGVKFEVPEPAQAETEPELSFKELTEKLVSMHKTIRDGFSSGDIEGAHGPLHEVGHVLEKVDGAASKEEFTSEQVDAINKAKETLFDAYGEVDKTLHGGEGKPYEEVSKDIDSSVQVIADAAGVEFDPSSAAAPAESSDEAETVEVTDAESEGSDDSEEGGN